MIDRFRLAKFPAEKGEQDGRSISDHLPFDACLIKCPSLLWQFFFKFLAVSFSCLPSVGFLFAMFSFFLFFFVSLHTTAKRLAALQRDIALPRFTFVTRRHHQRNLQRILP